jgi:hypothetical protein
MNSDNRFTYLMPPPDPVVGGTIKELTQERAVEWLSRACWSIGEVHWLLHGFEPVRKTTTAFTPPANAGDDVEKLDRAILAGHLAPLNPGNGEPCYAPADVIRVAEAVDFGRWQTWKTRITPEPAKDVQSIPGNIPKVASGRLAVMAAWEIERETGKRATAKQTMKLLQEWADSGKEPSILIQSLPERGAVQWQTQRAGARPYTLEGCQETLRKWNKSRQ